MRIRPLPVGYLLITLFFACALASASEENGEDNEPSVDELAEFADSLRVCDTAVVGTVKNVVTGTSRDYAVVSVSRVMKGREDLKVVYVGFDPDAAGEYFEVDTTALWLLDCAKEMPYCAPVEGIFATDAADLDMVTNLLREQNSGSPEDILFKVKTDREEYPVDCPVRITMTVSNAGKKTVTFDNALLWRFTHNYTLILEKPSGFEKLELAKPETGIVGEFSGPRFVSLGPGESTSRSFNLIRLVEAYPPDNSSRDPGLPPCNAYLKITWNTESLKEFFPEDKSIFAIEGNWDSEELRFTILEKALSLEEALAAEAADGTSMREAIEGVFSDDGSTAQASSLLFVEYASAPLEPEMKRMLSSDSNTAREAAGQSFLWLAKHPKMMESRALLDYMKDADSIEDDGAYNQVLGWIASIAIRQGRKDYVPQLLTALESPRTTVMTRKEIVAALGGLTSLELSEENFEETADAVRKWLESGDGETPAESGEDEPDTET
jgi:hypothetical protein